MTVVSECSEVVVLIFLLVEISNLDFFGGAPGSERKICCSGEITCRPQSCAKLFRFLKLPPPLPLHYF